MLCALSHSIFSVKAGASSAEGFEDSSLAHHMVVANIPCPSGAKKTAYFGISS